MKYMLLLYIEPDQRPEPGTPEADANLAAWWAVQDEMEREGVLVHGAALQPTEAATTVRTPDGGAAVLTDGPFAETREMLGGYYLLDVPDLDAAAKWAARMPNLRAGAVEIRPLIEFNRSKVA